MTPGQSRHRRARARRRRQNRRRAALFVLALALLAVLAVALSDSGGHARSPAVRHAHSSPPAKALVPTSAIGLALGTPPLLLKGLGMPGRDPLKLAFHAPPRAGLL